MAACENNHLDIVKFLFESGAVLSPFNSVLHPALYTATKKGCIGIVQELLLHIHIDNMSDTVTENGKSDKRHFILLLIELLTHTVSKGSTDIVQLLIHYTGTIKYDDILAPWRNWLYTFFTTACKHQHINTARLLLERGVDCNRIGIDNTYIILTLFTKPEPHCLELLKLMFEYNVNVDVIRTVTGDTALIKACDKLYYECIQALLAYVADANLANRNGVTALFKACLIRNEVLTKLLLEYGADVTMTSNSGHTAVDLLDGKGNSGSCVAIRAQCEEYREANSKRGYVCK